MDLFLFIGVGHMVPFAADIIAKTGKVQHPPLRGMGSHLRLGGNYEKLLDMKTITHLAALATAVLASCTCIGADIGDIATVTGVVSSVMQSEARPLRNWFTLRTPSGGVLVSVRNDLFPLDRLLALTDAEVEVHGPVKANDRSLGFSGRYLSPADKEGIRTTKPAPDVAPEFTDDPSDTEAFVRREAVCAYLHRVRLEGMLVAESKQAVFMEIADGSIAKMVMQTNAKSPRMGTMATATGFVSFGRGGLQMHDVVLSPAPGAKPPPPPAVWNTTLNDAHRNARHNNGFRRCIVSFTGDTWYPPDIIHMDRHIWAMSDGNFAAIDMSKTVMDPRLAGFNANLRVTGVCEPVFAPDTEKSSVPRFKGITIVPLHKDGITILDWPDAANERRQKALLLKGMIIFSINLLVLVAIVTIALVIQRIRYNRRGRQLIEERVARAQAQTKTEERTRLATELHDAVSQALTGVALQIDSANIVNRGENAALSKYLDTARQMLASCRRELRDCLWDLRSQAFDEKDMTEAVKRTIFSHTGGAKAMVRFNVERSRLSESKAHAILSMTRELVVNAVRHGKATQIWIAGECSDGHVSFSVRDNGCGFDPDAAPGVREGHFGLQGIRERVRAAKGTIKVESGAGKGAKITITLPEADVQ